MEPLIYYPTFEPPSDLWLKFALLYFDNFRPIVPHNRRANLSDDFRRVCGETDLVSLYEPQFPEGQLATINAIKEADEYFERPGRNSFSGYTHVKPISDTEKWRNPNLWNFEIYQEKFSSNWLEYCIDKGIGRVSRDGIIVSEELAFLFMANLAKEIAFKESAAIITDNNRFDNYTNYTRATTPSVTGRNRFAKGIISLLVPGNLAHISIDRLIRFRNTNREQLRAFTSELANIQDKISRGYSEQDFINSYNRVYSEYSREVVVQGVGIASIPFAAYILLHSPTATTPEYVKEILGALGIILGGGYALNRALVDSKNKRYCKKYLTNLQRLR